jgi:hypothetical protein
MTPGAPAYLPPSPAQRVAMRLQNPAIRGLLRTPARRLLGPRLVLLSFEGRRSGRRIELPVSAREEDGALVVRVGLPERKTWWRNFEAPRPVRVLREGHWQDGVGRAVADDGGVRVVVEIAG